MNNFGKKTIKKLDNSWMKKAINKCLDSLENTASHPFLTLPNYGSEYRYEPARAYNTIKLKNIKVGSEVTIRALNKKRDYVFKKTAVTLDCFVEGEVSYVVGPLGSSLNFGFEFEVEVLAPNRQRFYTSVYFQETGNQKITVDVWTPGLGDY